MRLPQREDAMPVWKLQPLDPSDPNWEASSHRARGSGRRPDCLDLARAQARRRKLRG
jgi:hypothetical protein